MSRQKDIIKLFIQTAMKYRWRTILAIVSIIVSTVLGAFVGPFIIAQVLDSMQSGAISLTNAGGLITAYILTQIWSEIIGWRINLYLIWTMQVAAQRDLYQRIFTQLTQQSLSFHSDRFGGALVSQTTKMIGAYERFWDMIFFQIIPTIVTISAATIILSFMVWQYALFLLGLSVVFSIAAFFGSRFMAERNKQEAQASTASNAHVADTVTNVMTIKSYGRETAELDTMNAKTAFWQQKSLSVMRGFLGVTAVYSSILATINIGALIAAIWAASNGFASISVVYLAVTYTFTVARQLWEVSNILRNYNRIVGDAHDMTEILSQEPVVRDKTSAKLSVKHGRIDIDRINFGHEADDLLFEDFSLHITPGQKVGLVGPSGSGKTTLTKLLLRFADVQTGEIQIDKQAIDQVTQRSLRESIAYVPQEPLLFHRSLRENIGYGSSEASDDDILLAAERANALDFIKELPDGLDTVVGERGVKLSGGQRQRIAIARAILKDAPILVLDEATSALDSESEKLIQASLDNLMTGRTSIVVAHRLSTIAKLDRIIVLDHGRIVEDGTHADLIEAGGMYSRLWRHQSGGFIED